MKATSIRVWVALAGMLCLSGGSPGRAQPAVAPPTSATNSTRLPPRGISDAMWENDVPAVQGFLDRQKWGKPGRTELASRLLAEAAEMGSLAVVDYLLKEGADPNALRRQSQYSRVGEPTALGLAVMQGYAKVSRRLLDAGADPNLPSGPMISPPLLIALDIHENSAVLIQLLIERGADPFLPDRQGTTAMQRAIQRRRSDWALRALDHINAPTYLATNGTALLCQALRSGLAEVAEALLRHGVNPNATNQPGLSPLQLLAMPSASEGGSGAPISATQRENLRRALAVAGARADVFTATVFGETNTVLALLHDNPSRTNQRDGLGNTPLHWAVLAGSPDWLEFWLKQGVGLDATNNAGQTALHLAVHPGDPNLVSRLLAAGGSPSIRNGQGQTPLELATAENRVQAASQLMKAGGAGLAAGRGPSLALHQAITGNNSNLFFASLATKTNLSAPNELGLSPLHLAVREGHLPFLLALLEAGANPNAPDTDGNTPLHAATGRSYGASNPLPPTLLERAMKLPAVQKFWPSLANRPPPPAQLQMVRLLLAHGADASRTNLAGISPIRIAVQSLDHNDNEAARQLVRLLSKAGGNLNALDENGETALHRAARELDGEQLARLLAAGFDPNARDAKARTPLHAAVERVYSWPEDAAEWTNTTAGVLLKAGADPNARDLQGQTPLHALVQSEVHSFADQIAATLLQNRANPNSRDSSGRTPLHLLLGQRWMFDDRDDICARLLAGGTDPNARDNEGRTPLHYGALGDGSPFRELPGGFLAAKPRLDATDANGDTPLHLAARTDTGKVYAALRKAGARADLKNHAGETPLWLRAVRSQQLGGAGDNDELTDLIVADKAAEIEALLACEPRLIHLTNRFGNPPLREAARYRRINVVEVLLRHGATWDALAAVMLNRGPELREVLGRDPRQATNALYGTPLLHLAAQAGSADNVRAVLDAGAAIHRQDRMGLTAWGAARMATNTAVAELLVQRGAKPTIFDAIEIKDASLVAEMLRQTSSLAHRTNQAGVPAAHLAVARGLDSSLPQMLEAGLPPDFATAQGLTLLHVAAVWNRTNAAKLLLQRGAQVEPFDDAGLTPLHWAAREGTVEVARLLLAAGASPTNRTGPVIGSKVFRGPDHFNALHQAVSAARPRMIEMLVQAGGNLNEPDYAGFTCWDLARMLGSRDDEIDRTRHVPTGRGEILNTDPLMRESFRRTTARKEVQSLVESLGGLPGQGQRRGASQTGR